MFIILRLDVQQIGPTLKPKGNLRKIICPQERNTLREREEVVGVLSKTQSFILYTEFSCITSNEDDDHHHHYKIAHAISSLFVKAQYRSCAP